MKDMSFLFGRIQCVPSVVNKKKTTSRHLIMKISNGKIKKSF